MKITPTDPPRPFAVGYHDTVLRDCANVELAPDEQVTFVAGTGSQYDVVRKSWGYYATPSVNGRLVKFGLRAALVRSRDGKCFIHLVERDSLAEYEAYNAAEGLSLITWLDDDKTLSALEAFCKG